MKTNPFNDLSKDQRDILRYTSYSTIFAKEVVGVDVEWFHREWLEAFENNDFLVLLAPRGHGKTTMVGSYILWRIIKDRNIRILIVTINQDKANSMMTFIKENITKNNRLIELFGDLKGGLWTGDQIRVKWPGRGLPHNEPTLKVLGVGSSIISAHYDLIILDDITDEANSLTEVRRQRLKDWYDGPLVGTFLGGIQVINIGTRWHQDDVHNYLMNKPGYETIRYQALLNPEEVEEGKYAKVMWPEKRPWNQESLKKTNKQRVKNGKDEIPNNEVLFLEFIKNHQGETFFEMQYQNKIIASGTSKFKPDWIDQSLERYRRLDGVPLGLKKFIGVDLGGEDVTSDWGVSTVIGLDTDGDIYVLDCVRTHSTINHQMDIMSGLDEKYNVSKIGIDSAAQQKSMTSQAIRDNPDLPIIPIKPSRINDRDTRTDRLAVLFETNRIHVNPNLTHLIDELRLYPRGKHDDCIDSLCFALECSGGKNRKIDWKRVTESIRTNRSKFDIIKT